MPLLSHAAPHARPMGPPSDRPLPLWMIFPLIFAGVYLSHLTLLRLPYYWDEAGYYIPAAYDFFHTGSLIPSSTLSNAHPPLPSLYLALWWKSSGFVPAITRTAMCVITAIALLGVYRLGLVLNGKTQVAVTTTLLTAIYPIWFAQSTLAHADMFAAAGSLWGLVFFFMARRTFPAGEPIIQPGDDPPDRGRPDASSAAAPACGMDGDGHRKGGLLLAASALFFSLAALSKETAIVTPLGIALWEFSSSLRQGERRSRPRLVTLPALLFPLLPLLAWYGYHHHRTGFFFGNPQYLRYNATQTLTPLRVGLALIHRILHLTAHMNMFVPVLLMCGAMLLAPLREENGEPRPRISPGDQAVIYAVLLSNLLFFSFLGGALLTRYLLPLYPLVLLLAVSTLRRRVRYWAGLAALIAIAFLLGLWVNPPYKFAPEDNLSYADVIRLHQQAIRQIVLHFPSSTVLTAWPATDELSKPELGYVRKPIPVVAIDNFSLTEIQKAAASTGDYTVGFAFSTKFDPGHLAFSLGGRNESFDTEYFGFHRDLDPSAIAHLLDGSVFWRAERKGEWAAVLHFNRAQVAGLGTCRPGRRAFGAVRGC